MNQHDDNESLLTLIGELLYKNQLLREANTSKDEAIDLIINHLMSAATFACSCGVRTQITFVRDKLKERNIELAHRKRFCFSEFRDGVTFPMDCAAISHWDTSIKTAEE